MKILRRSKTTKEIPIDTGGVDPRCDRVADLLKFTGNRRPPQVGTEARIDEVVETLTDHPHSQRVYVVAPEGELLGTISVRTLARHTFFHGHEPRVHPRRLLAALTSETAGDLMQKAKVVTRSSDEVTAVIRDMVGHRSEEAAVVDEDGRLLGDLTMADLLLFCRPGTTTEAGCSTGDIPPEDSERR